MIPPLQVQWSRRAEKDLQRLDRKTRQRIHRTVARFAETGHGDIETIEGETNLYRLRVGDWRVLFEPSVDKTTLHMLRVKPRGGAYQP